MAKFIVTRETIIYKVVEAETEKSYENSIWTLLGHLHIDNWIKALHGYSEGVYERWNSNLRLKKV